MYSSKLSKYGKILFLFVLLCVLPIYIVNAEDDDEGETNTSGNEGSLVVICPPIVLSNEEFSCSVSLNDIDKKILGVSIDYSVPSELAFISFDADNDLSIEGSSSVSTILVSDSGVDAGSIGVITFKSSSDVELGESYDIVFQAKVTYEDDVDTLVTLDQVTTTVMNQSITNLINYISVNDETIEVSDDVSEYSTNVNNDVTSAKISFSLNSSIEGLSVGTNPLYVNDLKVGGNIQEVFLTYKDEKFLTLTLNISRKDSDGNVITDSSDDNITENPQTGLSIFSVLLIMFLSIFLIIKYRRNQLKGEA